MIAEVEIGDIIRYDSGDDLFLQPRWAVFIVAEQDTSVPNFYKVIMIGTNMKYTDGDWSLDETVLRRCTKLA